MPLPNCSHYVISTIHKNGKVTIVEIDFNKTSFEQVKELYPDIHAGEYYSSFVNRYYSPTEGYVYCREILASEAKNYIEELNNVHRN